MSEEWKAVIVTHKGHPWYAEDDPLRRTAGYVRAAFAPLGRLFAPLLPAQTVIPPIMGSITSMPPLVLPTLPPQPMAGASLAMPTLTGGVAATPERLALIRRALP